MGLFDEAVLAVLENRRFLYTFFGRAFASEPDEQFIGQTKSEHTRDEFLILDEDGQTADLLKKLEKSVLVDGKLSEASRGEVVVEALRSEYTRLFVGPAKLPAPPWESVYVSHDHLLFQESTLAVREAYLREGFRAAGYPHEADDHIATEFGFMAALATRTVEACENDDAVRCRAVLEAQERFLDEHLLVWIQGFSNRLSTVGGISTFYPSFAALAALVCERDAEVIREILAEMWGIPRVGGHANA